MDPQALFDGLISFVCILVMVTFHEFGHAWTAWKCGDDTAWSQGRVSLNPIVHIDLVGTLILPLLAVVLAAYESAVAGLIIGWGRPVPVDVSRLRRRNLDDMLVSLAGPAMNIVLAILALGIVRVAIAGNLEGWGDPFHRLAVISVFLCFFNLLPIPPLDGSRVLKTLTGWSDESFLRWSQYGFLLIIIAIQVPAVQHWLRTATMHSMTLLSRALFFP